MNEKKKLTSFCIQNLVWKPVFAVLENGKWQQLWHDHDDSNF